MKKYLVLLLVLLPSLGHAQYWGERATERSFEQSGLYFKSHFLNTYGLVRFRDAVVGLIDDPFLELQVNPANLPQVGDGLGLVYVDFRGDRTEPKVISRYYAAPYYDMGGFFTDPRWYRVTRQEPEPVFSLGFLAYPFREKLRKVFIGATYQIIYKEEPFYTMPSWIYYATNGYDSFGERSYSDKETIPTQERYYGEDELSTEAHLFSAFLGSPVSDQVTAGVSINTVSHSRDGSYVYLYNDEYGTTKDWDYRYYQERSRNQDYGHFDLAGGLQYAATPRFSAGVKVGYLSGDADQQYAALDSSRHAYGKLHQSSSWGQHYFRSLTSQSWHRDGHIWYAGVDFRQRLEKGKQIGGYYKYSQGDTDLRSASQIVDTSNHISYWWSPYDTATYRYWGNSATRDTRRGTGKLSQFTHQGLLNLRWNLDAKSRLSTGLYFLRDKTDLTSNEPVLADRWSQYAHTRNDTTQYDDFRRIYEDKRLEWRYRSTYWTIQIPVFLTLDLDEHFSLMLGVNRILESWEIADQTTTFFTRREKTESGQSTTETNFAERYTSPTKKYTEDYTELTGSLEMSVSPRFRIRLTLDPETEEELRISQWWLSFRLNL